MSALIWLLVPHKNGMYPTHVDTILLIVSDGSDYQSQNLRYAPGNVTVKLPAAVRLKMTVMTVNNGVTVLPVRYHGAQKVKVP
jgi:hypothetical protein